MTEDTSMERVMRAYAEKRRLEGELDSARKEWIAALVAARDAGNTVAEMSRRTGVIAPNLFRLLAEQKKANS
jgi:hypothetical protein